MENFIKNRFELLFSILLLSLPFSTAIPNIVLSVIVILFIVDIRNFKIGVLNNSFKILILLVFFLILKSLLFGYIVEDFFYYSLFIILITIPILFLKIKNLDFLKNVALLSINLSVFISIYKSAIYYYYYHYLSFNDGWVVNQLLVLERPYAGVFSLISILISFELYQKYQKYRIIYFFSIALSATFIFIISARISILTLLLLLVIYLLFYLKKSIQYKIFLFSGMFFFLFTTVLLNKNLSKRFFIQKNIESTIAVAKASEPRLVIWDCAYHMISASNFNNYIGISNYKQINKNFNECYGNSIENIQKKNWFLSNSYNSHNQFIHFYLIGGIIGFLLFIIFIFHSLFYAKNSFFGLSIILIFTFFLITENIFQRLFGIYIFAIFISLYFTKLIPKNEKN